MGKIKIYLYQVREKNPCLATHHSEMFRVATQENGLELEILNDGVGKYFADIRTEFPRNYDVYLIHFSQTSEEALKVLRKQNPKALICVLSNAYDYISKELKENIIDITYEEGIGFREVNKLIKDLKGEA